MKNDNYLDKKPYIKGGIPFSRDASGIITLEIENKGFVNKICQKFFKKPKVSFIHLDEIGSFAIENADGEKTITEIGVMVKEKFEDKAEPLYERLAKFFQIMDSYSFLEWNKDVKENEEN